MGKLLKLLRSKTVWGGIIAGVPQIVDAVASGVLGPKAAGVATGIGIILGAVGVRDAINKQKP